MKVVILAAGYATRLSEVTNNGEIAKTVLPIKKEGKIQPMLYFLLDKINEIENRDIEIDEIIVATNGKYFKQIEEICNSYKSEIPIKVISNGTFSKEEALGANGDLQFINKKLSTTDNVLVVASDNYFDFKLSDLVKKFLEKREETALDISMIVSKQFPLSQMEYVQKGFAMLKVSASGKIESMIEKPLISIGRMVDSQQGAIACYLLNKKHLDKVDEYMEIYKDNKQKRDALGHFIGWLADNFDVYNFSFSGEFVDIGTPEQYYEALNG